MRGPVRGRQLLLKWGKWAPEGSLSAGFRGRIVIELGKLLLSDTTLNHSDCHYGGVILTS
ncbi:hypothetical protein SSOG_07939 [Streptomyces himastatinicus ATCC 53653]|uniref:Uncharacterized protein n=1 Tax=Streptomyces himastatinicus ATCC 53653 TaxID=457427 RepID=D9WRY1_9ACTN|nr:hypothetical protein SSOG_07939 [Streptomyces himastatinicus ATCC 53653]